MNKRQAKIEALLSAAGLMRSADGGNYSDLGYGDDDIEKIVRASRDLGVELERRAIRMRQRTNGKRKAQR